MTVEIGKDLATLRGDFDKLGIRIKSTLDEQDSELKRYGKTTEETGKRLDGFDAKWTQIAEDVKGLHKRLDETAAKAERERLNGGGASSKTLGQMFTESEQFKSCVAGDRRRSAPFEVKGAAPFSRKAVELTSAELGATVQEFRWDQVVQNPLRPRRIVDLIPTINVDSNSVEFPRENVTHELYTELTAAITGGTTDTISVERTSGTYVGQIMTVGYGTVAAEDAEIDTIDADAGTIQFTANLANSHAVGAAVVSDHFVFTPEAQLKPMSRVEYELITEAIKTLATMMPMSQQMLDDYAAIQALIDNRMREFLELSKERNVLFGDGSSNQLNGILNDPDILTYAWSSGLAGDTKLDAIRRSFTGVGLAFFPVDAVVLHDTDWEEIETTKGSDGHYIFAQAQTAPNYTQIWRAAVVNTPVIGQGQFLAGSFRLGAVLWDRQQVRMMVSDQNRDWFERNLVGIRLEERLALSVLRPKSFVSGTFDAEP